MIVNPQITCKGICKKFRVTKPPEIGRYESGQGRCQTCDIWIDHKGAKLKDGTPATPGSLGWFCTCCNFRIRQKPRSKLYKEKFHKSQDYSNIPKYTQMILPILQACNKKHHTRRELEYFVADKFNLTEQERKIILRGKETYLTNRTYWAVLYLKKANLLNKEDSFFSITEDGKKILQQNPSKIDKKFLSEIPAFARWIGKPEKKKPMQGNQLSDLIAQSLELIKQDEMYLSDLVQTLNISDDVRDLLVHKLLETQKVTKEDISHQGETLDILLKYEPPVENDSDYAEINMSYFNKYRAKMIQKIFQNISKDKKDLRFNELNKINGITVSEIETEFDISIEKFVELAYATEPPNIISIIREFEQIRMQIGRVPTKQDMDEHSEFSSLQYENEFESWEHMLERLGYDPWYRKPKSQENKAVLEGIQDTDTDKNPKSELIKLELLRQKIREGLKEEPAMLELFDVLDQDIVKLDKKRLEYILDHT